MNKNSKLKIKLPPILPGDKVGLVSPAGPVTKEQIQTGLDTLTKNGIDYEFGKNAFSDRGIVSASAKKRLDDINSFLERNDIKAIWALRGGYGSIQLLKKFNYSLLKQHPKLFIGFSDLTALHWAIFKETRIPSATGFVLTTQFNLENPYLTIGLEIFSGKRTSISKRDLLKNTILIITPGKAEGTLIGGTLSMICSICGTAHFPDREDLILFIEDINEPLYRIDRYFQQLSLLNFWSNVKGVILGQFLFEGKKLDVVPLLKPLVSDRIPIVSNFPYSHQTHCLPLIQGIPSRITTKPFLLTWENFIE